ncbi:hypothetical protein V491_09324 [Pseudogymnoascus sp. VKM F-3775]|nr:hypothetical protein V491_09324 [Pseudogymnoascus sp. VKM F-3775]
MEFLRENSTGILFPKLYAFEGGESYRAVEFCAVYMLIEGFYGNTLQDMQFNICDLPLSVQEQIITQWTSIQAELATFSGSGPPRPSENFRAPVNDTTNKRCQEWTTEFVQRLVNNATLLPMGGK